MKNTFPVASYKGIDVSKDAVSFGVKELRLDLYNGDYLNFPAGAPYSDVFMWDVIEHLQNPGHFIDKVSKEIIPGGRLYITTGDFASRMSRMQKRNWRMIHPPTHLHYFSKKNIEIFLKQYGFKVHMIQYPKTYRSIRQMFYSLFMLNSKLMLRLKRGIFNLIPENLFLPLNTYDIMFVVAEKELK